MRQSIKNRLKGSLDGKTKFFNNGDIRPVKYAITNYYGLLWVIMGKINYKNKDGILQILKQHKEELYKKYGVEEIGLFGSFARGEETDKSDIDILVEFKNPVSLLLVSSLEIYLSDLLGIRVDLVRKRNIRKELKDNILNEVVNLQLNFLGNPAKTPA